MTLFVPTFLRRSLMFWVRESCGVCEGNEGIIGGFVSCQDQTPQVSLDLTCIKPITTSSSAFGMCDDSFSAEYMIPVCRFWGTQASQSCLNPLCSTPISVQRQTPHRHLALSPPPPPRFLDHGFSQPKNETEILCIMCSIEEKM